MNNIATSHFRAVCLVVLSFFAFALHAQRERNYIYILDCSNSMVTDYHIWEPTLDFLQKDIDRLSDNTMVTVIPFQGNVFQKSVRHEQKKNFDWGSFAKEIAPYPQQLTGTNICEAWDYALNYVDPNKDNYIYLLTDGKDNRNPRPDGTDNVCKRIRQWCDKAQHTRGYYVALSDEAIDSRIRQVVGECPHMEIHEDGIHKPFGSFEKTEMSFNVLDPQEVTLPFTAEGTFSARLVSETPGVEAELVDGVIRDGRAKVKIAYTGDRQDAADMLEAKIKAFSDDVDIQNPDLKVLVRNVAERSLQLPVEQINLGEVDWYDSFWWKDAKPMDTLSVDLAPVFNQAALQSLSHVQMKFVETTTDSDKKPLGMQSELYVNGKHCTDGVINVEAGQPLVLSIIPHADGYEGKHYYALRVIPNTRSNLETINQEYPEDYELTMRSAYDIDTNPLKVMVGILALFLLGLLLLWFLFIKPMSFRRFHIYSVTVSEPYFNSIPIHNALRVVFTSRRRKQNILSRIFVGKVIYEVNPAWQYEWTLMPSGRSATIISSSYTVEPSDYPLELGTEYHLIDEENRNQVHTVSIN